MKKHLALIISVLCGMVLFAQQKMQIFEDGNVTYQKSTSEVDSVKFLGTNIFVNEKNGSSQSFSIAGVDSMVFASASDTIFVTFDGSSVSVNDYNWENITYKITGSNIEFTSAQNVKDIVYCLSGSSTDGSFTITPDHAFYLVMHNLRLTSATSSPIVINENLDESYTTNVVLKGTSTLNDASTSSFKGCIYAKSKLKFDESSTGILNVYGNAKHAINSSKKTEIYGGTINIKSALSDGLNSDGLQMYGGALNIENTAGDGVDVSEIVEIENGSLTINSSVDDVNGLKSDSIISIRGGSVNIAMTGAGSKAIKNGNAPLEILGGELILSADGGSFYDGTDYSFAAGIKSEYGVILGGGTTKITSTGEAAKGISSDNTIEISNGTLNIDMTGAPYIVTGDTTTVAGLKADGEITVAGGNTTITLGSNSTASKGISTKTNLLMTSGELNITNNGGYYSVSSTSTSTSTGGFRPGGTTTTTTTEYTEGKCISADANVTLTGGKLTLETTNGAKALKADANLTVGGVDASNDLLTISIKTGSTQTTSSSSTGGFGGFGGGASSTKYAGAPKGFLANLVTINSGVLTFNTKDDAIHGDNKITVNGGDITIDATDDGIHSDGDLTINNGSIIVNTAYEGFEGSSIYATGGYTYITSTDDAWNVFTSNTGMLRVSGGQHWGLSSAGDHDCFDSNGSMEFTGGLVVTCGSSPVDAGDGSNCYQKFTGGALLILGPSSAGMWNQDVKVSYTNGLSNTSCSISQGTTLCVANSSGKIIAACKVPNAISKVVFCYGSSLSDYSFYTTTQNLNFDLFNSQYTENASMSISNMTKIGGN